MGVRIKPNIRSWTIGVRFQIGVGIENRGEADNGRFCNTVYLLL